MLHPRNWPSRSDAQRGASGVVDIDLAAAALSEGVSPLTERERQVLAATDRGADIPEIARTLFLSRGTVRNHPFLGEPEARGSESCRGRLGRASVLHHGSTVAYQRQATVRSAV